MLVCDDKTFIPVLEGRPYGAFLDHWQKRFFALADMVASWSKDPSTKVGCVLVDPECRILGVGYNGFPRGVHDLSERLNDREQKYLFTQHAEANAIANAAGCLRGACAFVTHPPCAGCAGQLIQAGIAMVFARPPAPDLGARFLDSFQAADEMFEEAAVQYFLCAEGRL